MQRVALSIYVSMSARIQEIRDQDRERGLTTTEIAVLTFVLVTIAFAIGALLWSYAQGRVTALNDIDTNLPSPSN